MARASVVAIAIVAAVWLAAADAAPLARLRKQQRSLSARSTFHASASASEIERTCAAALDQLKPAMDNAGKKQLRPLMQDAALTKYCETADADCVEAPNKLKVWDPERARNLNGGIGPGANMARKALNAMMEWARINVQLSFQDIISSFAKTENDAGRTVRALVASPKKHESAWRKIKSEVGDDPYRYEVRRLVDGVRASYVYKSKADMEKGVCAFMDWVVRELNPAPLNSVYAPLAPKRACLIVGAKDRWTHPLDSGYADVLLSLECEWGRRDDKHRFITEVQFHVCSVMMVKQGAPDSIKTMIGADKVERNGHTIYEAIRALNCADPKNQIACAALYTESKNLYTSALNSDPDKCDLDKAPKFPYDEKDDKQQDEVEEVDVTVVDKKKPQAWVHMANIHEN